jgi:hypothetical protein
MRILIVNVSALKKLLFIPLAFLLLASCDDKPVFPNEPVITFVSITPPTPTQFSANELSLTFHYQDGDGDLGYVGDVSENIFLEDTRPAFANNTARFSAYHFESITPGTRKPSIQGEISISIVTPPWEATEAPLVYRLHIVDRAGNLSNVIETTPVTILR